MSSEDDETKALSIKSAADTAYRSKDFLKAREFYLQAIEFHKSPALLSNLSATEHELGLYATSAATAKEAIKIIDSNADAPSPALRAKNQLRLCRALVLLKNVDEALNAARDLLASPETSNEFVTSAKSIIAMLERTTSLLETQSSEARALVASLPLFRPALKNVAEYYTVGHDAPESLLGCPRAAFEDEDSKAAYERLRMPIPNAAMAGEEDWPFSALLIEPGDARNLYSSLIDILTQLEAHSDPKPDSNITYECGPRIHFTLVDVHPTSIARNLVVLHTLEELSHFSASERETDPRALDLLTMLHFVYWSCGMPPHIHEIMMKIIERVRENPDLPWAKLNPLSHPAVKESLDYWLEDALLENSVTRMTLRIRLESAMDNHRRLVLSGSEMHPESEEKAMVRDMIADLETLGGSRRERRAFNALKVLWPPKRLLDKEDPAIKKFLEAEYALGTDYEAKGNKADLKAAENAILVTSLPNVTYTSRGWSGDDHNFNPFDGVKVFFYAPYAVPLEPDFNTASAHDFSTAFFSYAAESVRRLRAYKNGLTVELFAADGYSIMDGIRFKDIPRPVEYPETFDRCHMSNVPDYAGGALTTFTVADALLKPHPKALVTFNCLLNAGLWEGGLADGEKALASYLKTYTGAKLEELGPLFGVKLELKHMAPMEYNAYTKIPNPSSSELLPRDRITRILHEVFFKTVLPAPWKSFSPMNVREPLNTNAFYRLIMKLVDMGYPHHWLSTVIEDILKRKLLTSARPTLVHPVPLSAPSATAATLFLDPFIDEFECITAFWAPLLPFGIMSSLRGVADVGVYQVKFPEGLDMDMGATHARGLALKFGKTREGTKMAPTRDWLLNPNQAKEAVFVSTLELAYKLEGEGVWAGTSKTATFIMSRSAMEAHKSGQHYVALWTFSSVGIVDGGGPLPVSSCKLVGDVKDWKAIVARAREN